MNEVNTCIDKQTGNMLKILKYSFSASPEKKQQEYQTHLQQCEYCRSQQKKHIARARFTGFAITVGGVVVAFIGLLVIILASLYMEARQLSTYNYVIYGIFLFGVTVIIHGVRQIKMGKFSDQM